MSRSIYKPSLATLPTELLMQITPLMDNTSLFSLAQVRNMRLNTLCSCELGRRIDGFSYSPDIGHVSLDMRALAPSIRNIILTFVAFESLHIYFGPTPFAELVFSGIHHMMSRQRLIRTFKLVDHLKLSTDDARSRWRGYVGLIKIALARGCQTLQLDLRWFPLCRFLSPSAPDTVPQLSLKNRKNDLATLEVHSNFLFDESFLPSMAELLSSPRITTMDISDLLCFSTEKLLSRKVPLLRHFYVQPSIRWEALKTFLQQNTHLSSITIASREYGKRDSPHEPGPICHFPRLDTLHIPPDYGCAFFPSAAQRAVHRGACRELTRCTIDLLYRLFIPGHTKDLVDTLDSISAGEYVSPGGHLHLLGISEYHMDQIEKQNADRPRPSFSSIHNLILTFHPDIWINPSRFPLLPLLKAFCSHFPDMRELRIENDSERCDWDFSMFDSLWPDVVRVCPQFEKGIVGWPGVERRQVYPRDARSAPPSTLSVALT
ncbi:hypothetical protein AX16_007137 [Volvariella volvacea WC 439]|nr:hypothetical protein AX16_007137 [Volvariella volvacea WC 439]